MATARYGEISSTVLRVQGAIETVIRTNPASTSPTLAMIEHVEGLSAEAYDNAVGEASDAAKTTFSRYPA